MNEAKSLQRKNFFFYAAAPIESVKGRFFLTVGKFGDGGA